MLRREHEARSVSVLLVTDRFPGAVVCYPVGSRRAQGPESVCLA